MPDWIKMRTDLYRHPKVLIIADHLIQPDSDLARYVNQNLQCDMAVTRNAIRNAVVGALVAVWGVVRHRGTRKFDDIFIDNVTPSLVDDIADLPGFGAAMTAAGWLRKTKSGLVFPQFFADHNADPDKSRANNRARQRRFREKKVTRYNSALQALQKRDRNAPRVEGEKRVRKPTGKESRRGLVSVDEETLRNTGKLLAWVELESKRSRSRVKNSEHDRLRVLAAAERALEKGEQPVALFVDLVTHARWDQITQEQERRAAIRLRANSSSPAEQVAKSLTLNGAE